MDLTAIRADAIYQEAGNSGIARYFTCDVICTTVEDPETGKQSSIVLIHDIEKDSVVSLEAAPIVNAINIESAKNKIRKGK